MKIDGKLIAHELKSRIREQRSLLDRELSLAIIVAKETPAIAQFVEQKVLFGKDVKVRVDKIELSSIEQKNEILLQQMLRASKDHDGLIVQLPVPTEFSIESILKLYPMSHDVDVLGDTAFEQFKEGNLPFLPPVVGAFSEVLERNDVNVRGKEVVIIGEGRLVGAPTAIWMDHIGATYTVANKETENLAALTQTADILISGTGVPGLIQPDMVKEGVVILDAGAGEMAGVVRGDVDPACESKASLFTPTPGGIGPITIAKVFENLISLYEIRHKKEL